MARMQRGIMALLAVMVVGLLALGVFVVKPELLGLSTAPAAVVEAQAELTQVQLQAAQCADDRDTSVVFDVVNLLNTTASEGQDVETRFYSKDSGHIVRITDTTAPTASNLNCGEKYVVKLESTDGSRGDNSYIRQIQQGDGDATIVDGNLEFTATGSSMSFEVGIHQQAILEVRAKDLLTNIFVLNSTSNTATDYSFDGVAFGGSETANSSIGGANLTVDTGGEVRMEYELRARDTSGNWNDRGVYLLLDAASTVWDVTNAVVKFDGQVFTNYKDQLTDFEARAWSDYERIYFVPVENADITRINKGVVEINMFAVSGVNPNPANSFQLDVAARGQYQQTTSSNALAIGGVIDDSATTTVRTLFDITQQVS